MVGSEAPSYDLAVSDGNDRGASDVEVIVQTEWNGWRTAMVRLAALESVHWFQPAGACRPLVHGLVRCTEIRSGTLTHACDPATRPHIVLVCVLKSHTLPSVFERLARAAGGASSAQQGEHPCGALS
jgi:hypothetical protein